MRRPVFYRRLFSAALAVLVGAGPASAAQFGSPQGNFLVDVTEGENPPGSGVKPFTADIRPLAGGPPVRVSFQLIRYSSPTDRTLREAFRWSPDESAVAIQNRSGESKYGFRIVPLRKELGWKARDLAAIDLQWVDGDRLVFQGDGGNEGNFIGIFDVRTGRVLVAHEDLSRFTDFKVIAVTPITITFRETKSAIARDVCYAFNTETGRRTALECPQ